MNKEFIAKRLKELRGKLTQDQLSDLTKDERLFPTKVSAQVISNWETEKSDPSIPLLDRVCKALNLSLADFFLTK